MRWRAGVRAGRWAAPLVGVSLVVTALAGCGGGDGAPAAADPVAAAEDVAVVRTSPIADLLAKLPARVDGARIVVGDPKAPKVARVLADPRCSWCARFEATGGETLLRRAAEGKVRVEYVLASFLDSDGTRGSAKAVNALRAAAERGRFAEYHAALFASQVKGGFTDEHLLRIADRVPGLRGAGFDAEVRTDRWWSWAARAQREFEAAGVPGTPVVLVEGKPVGAKDRSMFDAAAFADTLRKVGIG
ncbi:DsbA family protein [Streptomyces sp. BI20]|uniref:DsbA family protein n=1 Tax=Streptomyces sp. BI20 TaxID=3403460 RepID=UPI003C77FB8A